MNNELKNLNFPSRFLDIEFDLVKVPEIWDWIERWNRLSDPGEKKDNEGLYIHGGSDAGKTTIAVNIVKKLIGLGITDSVFYVNFSHFAEQIYQLQRGQIKKEGTFWEQCSKVKFLVLDDFGRANITKDYLAEKIYLLLNHRYEKYLPMIVTSNYSIEELSKKIEDRDLRKSIFSRLKKMMTEVKLEIEF